MCWAFAAGLSRVATAPAYANLPRRTDYFVLNVCCRLIKPTVQAEGIEIVVASNLAAGVHERAGRAR